MNDHNCKAKGFTAELQHIGKTVTNDLWQFHMGLAFDLKLHSHQTPDQPPLIPDQFLWLGRVWSGKKLPALIEERTYPRSTSAVSALYPWCTHAQIPLFPTYTRPSGWPIPALYDRPRHIPDVTTLTTLNIGPTPDLYAWFPLPASNE